MNAVNKQQRTLKVAASSNRTSRLAVAVAWLVTLASGWVLIPALPAMSAHTWAWIELGLVVLGLKSVVLASADPIQLRQAGRFRLLGFVFLWPGMKLEPFMPGASIRPIDPSSRERDPLIAAYLRSGLANCVAGLLLHAALRLPPLQARPYLFALVGLTSVALLTLFGLFDLLAALWRWFGINVHKQWSFLPATHSLAEYWSQRWNRSFHDFARQQVYLPLKRRWGGGIALFGSFLFSGLMHDLVISVPARGGYGLPTLYFLLQGAGIWIERRKIRRPLLRRLWAWLVVIGPIGLLLHRPFIERVVLPQLQPRLTVARVFFRLANWEMRSRGTSIALEDASLDRETVAASHRRRKWSLEHQVDSNSTPCASVYATEHLILGRAG